MLNKIKRLLTNYNNIRDTSVIIDNSELGKDAKINLYISLMEDAWREFDQKAHFEWKFSYALWATMLACIVLLLRGDLILSGSWIEVFVIVIVFSSILLCQIIFLKWIHKQHDKNRGKKSFLFDRITDLLPESEKRVEWPRRRSQAPVATVRAVFPHTATPPIAPAGER